MSDRTHARRVVAITGGSSGIGRCSAQLFASRGWDVGLMARSEEPLEETRAELERLGARVATVPVDVADSGALDRAADSIEQQLGPIDVWINDAGIGFIGAFPDIREDEFRRVTETVYFGTVNGTRTALARMKPRDRGTIVNIASAVAYRAAPLQSPYSGAKYAVRGFTEAVRSELIHDGSHVHLTMVHPPAVNTMFFAHAGRRVEGVPRPPPPVFEPEVIADAVYLAATSNRREVFVTGATVQMAWLNKLMPGALDWVSGKLASVAQVTRDRANAGQQQPALFEGGGASNRVHGAWSGQSMRHSAQMWVTRNRWAVGLGAIAVLALLGGRQRIARAAAGGAMMQATRAHGSRSLPRSYGATIRASRAAGGAAATRAADAARSARRAVSHAGNAVVRR